MIHRKNNSFTSAGTPATATSDSSVMPTAGSVLADGTFWRWCDLAPTHAHAPCCTGEQANPVLLRRYRSRGVLMFPLTSHICR